ncbi:TetR/AcrR family transcriptional regulator [Cellulomonas hominis]|uniref:TetR/AcrR family transcriptional regulator n=1 Tax=Cellulomonas hominis TaxID=156981 RepID=UPI001B90B89C|nr:TetR/AcrR family transcriptional regulator [Cellulomonas hominis]VTR78178.1 HTH-type transcriptional regulator RcdA [Cellulomonas hominis]
MATTRTAKGDRRRDELARAAADLVREDGPSALSHRAVAARAGVSLSATTYYYSGLDALAAAAGAALVDDWVAHAEGVLARVVAAAAPQDAAEVLVDAVLPPGDDAVLRAHYEQLVTAGRVPALAAALGEGRARLDDVLGCLLAALGSGARGRAGDPGPAVVLALVDGAVVAALSEGRDVRAGARDLLHGVLGGAEPLR